MKGHSHIAEFAGRWVQRRSTEMAMTTSLAV